MAPGQTVEAKDLPQDLIDSQSHSPTVGLPAAPMAHAGQALPSAVPSGAHDSSAFTNGAANAVEKSNWATLLEIEASLMLANGQPEVMDALGRQFESTLIRAALRHTHGRKNDAAVRLGIGRNTITRKIHELGIDGAKDD
jgi:two-component system nitrogen regulation response regulator GlnG